MLKPSLVPKLLPNILSHTVKKKKEESLDDLITVLCDDVLCVVLCVVWVRELSPTHAVSECLTMLETDVALSDVTALDACCSR